MPDTLNADVRFRLDLAALGPVTIRQTGYEHTAGSNHSGWAVGSIDLSGWLLRRYGVELPAGESIYIGLDADMTLRPADGTPAGAWASDAPANIWVGVGRTALAADTSTANTPAKITADTAAFRGGALVGTGEEWSQGALAAGHGTATGWHGTNPEAGTPLRWQWSYYSANAPGRYVTLPDTSFIVNVLVSSAANWVAAGVTQMDLTLAGTVEITVQRFVDEVQSSISPAAANELAALTAAVQAGYETVGAEAAGSAITAGASTSATVIAGPDIAAGKIYELRTGGGSAVLIDGSDIAALTPSAAPAVGAPIDLRGRSHHLQVWRTGAGYVAEDVILGRTVAGKLLAQWEVPQALAAVRYVELARIGAGAEVRGHIAEIVDDLRAVEAVQRAADYTTTLHGSPVSITARAGDDGSNFTALTAYQIPDSTVRPAQPLDVNVTGYHPVQIETGDLAMAFVQARGTTDWGPASGQADVTLYYRAYPLYESDGHTRHGEMWVGAISTAAAGVDPDPLNIVVSFTVAGTYDGVQIASKDLISRGTAGAGLTQTQVDGRIRALVEAWARVGGGDVPSGRIDDAVTSLVADQIGRRAVDEIEAVFAALFTAADTNPAAVIAGAPGAGGPLGHALAGSSKIAANGWLSLTMGAGYDVRRHIDADHVLELSARAVAGQALTDDNSIEYHAERKGLPTGLTVRLGAAADGTPVVGYSAAGSYAGVRVAAESADIDAHIADYIAGNSRVGNPVGALIATSAALPTTGITDYARTAAGWTLAPGITGASLANAGATVRLSADAWPDNAVGVVWEVLVSGAVYDRAFIARPMKLVPIDRNAPPGDADLVYGELSVGTAARVYTVTGKSDQGATNLRIAQIAATGGAFPSGVTVRLLWWVSAASIGPSGSGAGLTQAQVDARVRALVAAQGLAADTSRWPAGKIPTGAAIADELDALAGADRLSYRSLRDAPPPVPPGEIDADAVQIIVDRAINPVVVDVAEISDELDETSALAAARWDSTETPWQTIHPYPAAGIARRVDGAAIARGGFHRLWIADYGADGVALVDDAAVLGHATTSPDAQLGEVNGLAVELTDTGGAGTGETAYIGHGADGAAYISFQRADDGDVTNNSYGNPWRVRLEALTPAAGPVASDDTLTGDGTARSPLAVSTHAALPPPSLALGSRGEVLRRLNVTEAEMADEDLAQIDDLLDTVREYLTAHMGADSLATRRVRTAAVWMTAMAYQLRAQGIGEVDLAGMAQTQEIADMLRGLREVSL